MFLTISGTSIYVDTAGAALLPHRPTALLLHGVLNDDSVWFSTGRALVAHGWNVLAPDLRGHGVSAGTPPASIEEAADWALALLDAADVSRAAFIGHSMGSLIALQAAAQAPQRATHLALLATAAPMRVAPALLATAAEKPQDVIETVARYSHSTRGTEGVGGKDAPAPIDVSRALMRRVLASNPQHNLALAGFTACDRYQGAELALAKVRCPTLFVMGSEDHMTPPRSARALAAHARCAPRIVEIRSGHAMMLEAPSEVSDALVEFLGGDPVPCPG